MMIWLLLSCKGTLTATVPVETKRPDIVAPLSATESAQPVVLETITLDPGEVTYDESAGTLIFSPGTRVRAARYTLYILDLGSVEAVLGARPAEPVTVVVEIAGIEEDNHIPDSPQAASPDGGFRITTKTGRIVSAVE
jgi:hypothetical protein